MLLVPVSWPCAAVGGRCLVLRFGVQGNALSIYVRDPDSNVLELRTYGGGASS